MQKITINEIKYKIKTVEAEVRIHEIKREQLKRLLKLWPDDPKIKKNLETVNHGLKKWKKIRRRAKCSLYNYRYNHSSHGSKKRRINERNRRQRLKMEIMIKK